MAETCDVCGLELVLLSPRLRVIDGVEVNVCSKKCLNRRIKELASGKAAETNIAYSEMDEWELGLKRAERERKKIDDGAQAVGGMVKILAWLLILSWVIVLLKRC